MISGSSLPEGSVGIFDEFRDTAPVTFICPLARTIMIDPVIDREGNSYDRTSIEEWLNSGNNVSPLTLQPLTRADLATNRALRDAIEQYVRERGGLRNIVLPASPGPPVASGPPVRWKDSPLAQMKTMRSVALKLCAVELTPAQKAQVERVFAEVLLRDEARWYPEFDAAPQLRAAAALARWAAHSQFRMRVYGEFAQWLRPQAAFEELGRLDPAVKRDAEAAYLASAAKPHLVTDLDVVRDALAAFGHVYGRGPTPFDGRVYAEQARRWTLQ